MTKTAVFKLKKEGCFFGFSIFLFQTSVPSWLLSVYVNNVYSCKIIIENYYILFAHQNSKQMERFLFIYFFILGDIYKTRLPEKATHDLITFVCKVSNSPK